jgi:hypothetical protein
MILIFTYSSITWMLKVIGLLLYLIQICSHLFTLFANPGLPDKNNYISEEVIGIIVKNAEYNSNCLKNYIKCETCNILVNAKSEVIHCKDCNLCIEGSNF